MDFISHCFIIHFRKTNILDLTQRFVILLVYWVTWLINFTFLYNTFLFLFYIYLFTRKRENASIDSLPRCAQEEPGTQFTCQDPNYLSHQCCLSGYTPAESWSQEPELDIETWYSSCDLRNLTSILNNWPDTCPIL